MTTPELPDEELSALVAQTKGLTHEAITLQLQPDSTKVQQLAAHALYGKVVSDIDLIKKPVVQKLVEAWNLLHEIQVTEQGANIYLFNFALAAERNRILNQAPWSVLGYHLILRPWKPYLTAREIDFSTTNLWVRVCSLPQELHSMEKAQQIGQLFHRYADKELNDDKTYIRLQIEQRVTDPLVSGFYLSREPPPPLWIQFCYERVSDFCFTCGRLGHTSYGCPVKITNQPKETTTTS